MSVADTFGTARRSSQYVGNLGDEVYLPGNNTCAMEQRKISTHHLKKDYIDSELGPGDC